MINLLTIDVEEWFHTSALDPYIGFDRWDSLESRLEPNVNNILELLTTHQIHATFFVLGWVAERYPALIRQIDAGGHEIGSHGYRHRLIYHLSPETFKDYVLRSKHLLEDLISKPVLGYRATSFSIVKDTLWALEVIKEAGFIYDSSIFPIRHDIYGIDGFPRFPFVHQNGLIEIPPSTLRIVGRNFPVAGGGYFRLYPYWITRKCLQRLNRAGYPGVIYLHPWELDPGFPRIGSADWLTRFRQYVNLAKTEGRLERLLSEFKFITISEYLNNSGLMT
jgi:polysaccharide deacetylase family protein (PEP-CTERM system associated)